jgi:hypothetical protein
LPSVRVFGQGNSERGYRTHLKFSEPAKLVAYLICDHDAPLSVDVPENVYQKGTSSREHGRARLPQKQAAVNPTKLCQNPFKQGCWSCLSEKQTPQVIVFSEKLSERGERLERAVVHPRQARYQAALRRDFFDYS